MSATLTIEQAVLVGRIRDALRKLGYAVPAGTGAATFADAAALAPVMRAFAKTVEPEYATRIANGATTEVKARLLAEAAEARAARLTNPTLDLKKVVGVAAAGFIAYRAVKRKGAGLGYVAGTLLNHLAALSR